MTKELPSLLRLFSQQNIRLLPTSNEDLLQISAKQKLQNEEHVFPWYVALNIEIGRKMSFQRRI